MNFVDRARQLYRHRWVQVLSVICVLLMVVSAFVLPRLNAHAANPAPSTPQVATCPANPTSWPSTFLGDNARSNYNSAETAINPTTAASLGLCWEDIGAHLAPISAQPVISNGFIYWGSWSGHEHANDPATGNQKPGWSTFIGLTRAPNCYPPKEGVASTPTVATVTINGQPTSVVYVGGGDSNIYALDAMTGKIIWHKLLGIGHASSFIWGSPAYYNGFVYIGVASVGDCPLIQGQIVQLDAVTGKILNTFNTVPNGCIGASVWGSVTIDEQTGMLYFATGNSGPCSQKEQYAYALVELQASNLSYVSSWSIPGQKGDRDFGSTPTLFQATINGNVVNMIGLVSKNGNYYAFDRSNIAAGPIWTDQLALSKQNGGDHVDISSSSWDGTTLYAAANITTINGTTCTSTVSAINPANGSYIWQNCLNTGPQWAPVMTVPGLVIVGSGPTLYVFNATDGSTLFSYTASRPGAYFSSSVSVSNGVLYAGDFHGDLYAFAPSGPAHKQ
jgi:outer membrane protein assembly factor BamB